MLSVALCAGMAAPAFAYDGEPVEEVEQPVLTAATEEEEAVTVTDEETGALTPEGNLTLVDDYHTDYSDGSGQQFITLVSKSGATFYLVIDRNAKGQQTVHFMNLVDEADLLSLMEDEDAEAYTAEKEAAAQAAQERKQAEEDAKKAAEEAEASGSEQTGGNKVTKYAATFLGVLALVGLVAGGGIYTFMKQKQKKQAEKEALDPDANYTEDKGDFEIPVEDEPEETGEEDWLIQFSTKYHLSYMGAVSELLKQLDSLHSYDLLNQYAMKSLTIAPDNPKAYCWLIRSLKAQGMNELATNELAAAKEHLTTEEYEEILAFGANW